MLTQPLSPVPARHDVPDPGPVADPLLWRCAAQVAAAHQPDPAGRCHNLQCRHESGPCGPWRAAQRALELAGRPHATSTQRAVGRARVHGDGFTVWPRLQRTPGRRRSDSFAAVLPLPRRTPGAALRAAA